MRNLEEDKGELEVYELCFLILPSITEDKIGGVIDSLRKIITEEGGLEIDREDPFRQTLAYPMSKTIGSSRYIVSDAYIGWIKFEIDKVGVLAVKTQTKKISEIVRFLVVKARRETVFTFAQARETLELAEAEESETPSPVNKEVLD